MSRRLRTAVWATGTLLVGAFLVINVAIALAAKPSTAPGRITVTDTRKVGRNTIYKLRVDQEGIPLTCVLAENHGVAISCVEGT